ncbi:hypothetical protein Hanom_Chr05g00462301 [Helianthus anomalus]
MRTKAVKRKQADVEAAAQPVKKVPRRKIGKRGNLDAFVTKLSPEKPIPSVRAESSSVFIDDLPPSSPRASIREQLEGTKAVEMEVEKVAEMKKPEGEAEKPDVEVEKTVEVEVEKTTVEGEKIVEAELEVENVVETEDVDAGVTKPKSPKIVAREPEKGKSIQEDPIITIPFSATTYAPANVEKSPAGDQGFFTHDEEDSPIRPEETLGDYYYRSYFEKRASDIHAPIWKLMQAEVKFQEERSHDQTYHAYLEETASSTSTTHHIRARVTLLRAKLEADQAKFESEQKTEEWCAAGWKRKAEAALLSDERKCWREICEKDNNEKMGLQNNINNLMAEVKKLKREKAEAEYKLNSSLPRKICSLRGLRKRRLPLIWPKLWRSWKIMRALG